MYDCIKQVTEHSKHLLAEYYLWTFLIKFVLSFLSVIVCCAHLWPK
jgi:hypothetical protein